MLLMLLLLSAMSKTALYCTEIQNHLKGGVVKYIESGNFWTINEKYIIVYIYEKEMSQIIHFWHQILQKIQISWENWRKKLPFWLNISRTANK